MPTLPVFKIFKKYRLNKTTKTTPSITSPHHTSGSHKGSTSQIFKASQSSSVASTSGTEKEVRLDAMFYKHLEEMHRKEFLSEANRFYRVVDQKPDRTFLSRPTVMRNGNHSSPIRWAG